MLFLIEKAFMAELSDKLTPMFAQYKSIKQDYPDALLFFRMGDFYELFFEDAITASRELQIALTSRGKGGASSIPMCGVPWHASQSYLAQLIDRGYNVAICEQISDPKASRGLVSRAVTRVITPGTALDESSLDAKSHNYLGAIFCGMHNSCAFAWADVSTGQWTGLQFRRQADLWQWVSKLSPAELLVVDGQQHPGQLSSEGIRLVHRPPQYFDLKRASERILREQKIQDLASAGLDGKPELTRACGAILAYLEQTQMRHPGQLMPFQPLDLGKRLIIDDLTERNLEIFTRMDGRKGKGTLRNVLDNTITAMGGRLLEDTLRHPWRDIKILQQIQACVAFFHKYDPLRTKIRALLEEVQDLERLSMRFVMNRATVRDYFALRDSLRILPELKTLLLEYEDQPPLLKKALDAMDALEDCSELLTSALIDDFQPTSSENGFIRPGYNPELDHQTDLTNHGEEKLQQLLEKEQNENSLPRLKLGYNRVFGYYFEISRINLEKGIPPHFIRKQTLANGERFSTGELKSLEEDILQAEERRKILENEALENLRLHISSLKERIAQTSDILAQIDYWQSLGETGRRENWVLPELDDSSELKILGARHPVVEDMLGKTNFVPNDIVLDKNHRLCLVTGPNMAGKSTILRQVALICLLAQTGGMVPATSARLGIVDRLFSRVGASDNLARGQSTFMVEMMETARILRQAGKRSLVILDEIGRGTSTYDGMAIAWAVVEELAARAQGQIRTLFATHYHELTSLEGQIPGLFTMNVSVGEFGNNEIIFLHRLLPGPSDKSYGVEVARLAGVPYPVVQRARDILKDLEQKKNNLNVKSLSLPGLKNREKLQTDFLSELSKLDLTALDGEKALGILKKWQQDWIRPT